MNKNTIILSVVSIAILLALIAYGSMQMKKPVNMQDNTTNQMGQNYDNTNPRAEPKSPAQIEGEAEIVACTMEAKQCPDGTYVGRQGPRCEFAPCPGN